MTGYEIDLSPYINEVDFAVIFDSAEEADCFVEMVREIAPNKCLGWDKGEAGRRYDAWKKNGEELVLILNCHDYLLCHRIQSCDYLGWIGYFKKSPPVLFSDLVCKDKPK